MLGHCCSIVHVCGYVGVCLWEYLGQRVGVTVLRLCTRTLLANHTGQGLGQRVGVLRLYCPEVVPGQSNHRTVGVLRLYQDTPYAGQANHTRQVLGQRIGVPEVIPGHSLCRG